jgi:hypothetical protein
MMEAWPSVIATSPADPEADARATLSAARFRQAVKALRVSRITWSCRRSKLSPTPRIC